MLLYFKHHKIVQTSIRLEKNFLLLFFISYFIFPMLYMVENKYKHFENNVVSLFLKIILKTNISQNSYKQSLQNVCST